MVRRTRTDVMTYFKQDMKMQGLTFPEFRQSPKIVYKYEGELETIFNHIIKKLQEFTYARYTPLLYYIGNKTLSEFERQQQRNVGGFMKGILVKRFGKQFPRFSPKYWPFHYLLWKFIEMYQMVRFTISKKVDVKWPWLKATILKIRSFCWDEKKAQKYDSKGF